MLQRTPYPSIALTRNSSIFTAPAGFSIPVVRIAISKTGTNLNIRLNAATLLGAIDDEKAIPALIATLKDNNKLVRREASTALSRMGEPAVDPLIETLNDEDWRVRGAAAWALGNLGDEKAIPALEELLDDESGFVKSGAQSAIASIKK